MYHITVHCKVPEPTI